MDNKWQRDLNKFLEGNDFKDENELREKMQEFMNMYNNEEIEFESTPLDEAYDLLDMSQEADSLEEALKYANEAYKVCPECFDALIRLACLEENPLKRLKMLNKGLTLEENKLKKEEFFKDENIGHFYGIFETRPYIRGLRIKAGFLLEDGKIRQAKAVCEEVLRLNEYDNTGARYLLMAIHAYLENEEELLKLYKKFPEEHLEVLFPLFALYYKLGDNKKAGQYLDRINKSNKHFIEFFKDGLKKDTKIPRGYYSIGDISEINMYFDSYNFIVLSMPNLNYFVLDHFNKKRK